MSNSDDTPKIPETADQIVKLFDFVKEFRDEMYQFRQWAETEIRGLRSDVNALKADVKGIKEELKAFRDDFRDHEKELAKLQLRQIRFEERLDDMEARKQ